MDVIYPGGSREAYYDRTFEVVGAVYEATGVAAHARTLRDTYTVPANKILMLNHLSFSQRNEDALGSSRNYYVDFEVDDGVSFDGLIWSRRDFVDKLIEYSDQMRTNLLVKEAGEVRIYTQADGGATTSVWKIHALGILFDV